MSSIVYRYAEAVHQTEDAMSSHHLLTPSFVAVGTGHSQLPLPTYTNFTPTSRGCRPCLRTQSTPPCSSTSSTSPNAFSSPLPHPTHTPQCHQRRHYDIQSLRALLISPLTTLLLAQQVALMTNTLLPSMHFFHQRLHHSPIPCPCRATRSQNLTWGRSALMMVSASLPSLSMPQQLATAPLRSSLLLLLPSRRVSPSWPLGTSKANRRLPF